MSPDKKNKIIYWTSTGILSVFILPGIFFLNSSFAREGSAHLGLPLWFHWELGIGKFIGGIILIFPMIGKRIKEWVYVAFGIDFISATIAHIIVDGVQPISFSPLVFMAILIVSYIYYHKIQDEKYLNKSYKPALYR